MKWITLASVLIISLITVSGYKPFQGFGIRNLFNKNSESFNPDNIGTIEFTQRLDHFNSLDTRTFVQTVRSNNVSYVEGGPIFIFIAENSPYISETIYYGNVYDVATELNGIMYTIEPRFFSFTSRPTVDLSLESLRYLTIDQTIADYGSIITYIREQLPESRRVIVIGLREAARIATWLKQQYPFLIDGVYAMSAPLNIELEFAEYFDDIATLFQNDTQITDANACGERLGLAFFELDAIIESGNTTRIDEVFNMNQPLDASDPQDIGLFFTEVTRIFDNLAGYLSLEYTNSFCNTLVNNPIENDLEALAELTNIFVRYHVNYQRVVQMYREEEWESESGLEFGLRQSLYISCTQVSLFRTSSMLSPPVNRRFELGYWVKVCQDVFGENFNEEFIRNGNLRTNEVFGGFNPGVNNVYFTNGGTDPSRLVGITNDLNANSPADVIPGFGSGWDFASIDEFDTPEIIAIKERARDLIIQWTN